MSLSLSTSHPTSTSKVMFSIVYYAYIVLHCSPRYYIYSTTTFFIPSDVLTPHLESSMFCRLHFPIPYHPLHIAVRFRVLIHFKTQFSSLCARIFPPALRRLQRTPTLDVHIYEKNHLLLSITFLTALQRLLLIHCSPLSLDSY